MKAVYIGDMYHDYLSAKMPKLILSLLNMVMAVLDRLKLQNL